MTGSARCVMCEWKGPLESAYLAGTDCPSCPQCGAEANRIGGVAIVATTPPTASLHPLVRRLHDAAHNHQSAYKADREMQALLYEAGETMDRCAKALFAIYTHPGSDYIRETAASALGFPPNTDPVNQPKAIL